MRDFYFAQYLLNTGEITPQELPSLLANSASAEEVEIGRASCRERV